MSPRLLLLLAISFAIAERVAAADDPTRRRFDPDPPRLALSLDGNFTTETAAAADRGNWRFASLSDGFALVPSLVVTRTFGRVRLDGQVGYQIRNQGQYAQLVVHDGWVYALGGSLDLPRLARLDRWKAIAEIDGGWPRGNDFST